MSIDVKGVDKNEDFVCNAIDSIDIALTLVRIECLFKN